MSQIKIIHSTDNYIHGFVQIAYPLNFNLNLEYKDNYKTVTEENNFKNITLVVFEE